MIEPGRPRTSVVIPAYRAWSTLPHVLDALMPQVGSGEREVIVVDSSRDRAREELERRWPGVRFVLLPERTLPGRARNIGTKHARGDLLAFLDADALPEPGLLEALESGLAPHLDAVAGAVTNGTPRSLVGTAGYLLEFANWLPGPPGPILHAPTCNLLVWRDAFERAGGFPEDLWPGEDTVFTFGLGTAGRLRFAPDARVRHLNRTGLREFLRHQRRLGVAFARVCERVDFPHRSMGRPRAAVLAAPFRLGALALRLLRHPAEALRALLVLPLLIAGVVAWAVGLARAGKESSP